MYMTSQRTVRAVFLGAPGAGKGTQAMRLANSRGFAHISTGDMLRGQVAQGSELGQKAKAFMDSGKLVPDDLIIAMVQKRIAEPDARAAWILDGFPRTLPQAVALDRNLAAAGSGTEPAAIARGLTHVIFFAVPEQALVGRLSGRRTCSGCGAIWHVETKPTRREGLCDACGRPLLQRADDRPEAISKRLEVYRVQTEPLLSYYRDKRILREVDASRPPDAVYGDLVALMQ
jgi:adenylate kinase